MNRLLATGLLILLVAPAAFARGRQSTNISISTEDYEDITSCDQVRVTFDEEAAIRAEEKIDAPALRSLSVKADHNGGVQVTGWDGSGYQITACKAGRTAADLADLHASLRGNELTASGSEDRQSIVYFLVRAPRGADLHLEANNGGIGVHNVSGTIVANTTNGPISIRESSGTITADAQNGPIDLAGGSGTVKLRAENGPIGVKLAGATWDGSIDAHSNNGPISLKLPRDYRSGVVVESDGHSPFSCRAEACRQAIRSWDDEDAHRIELGTGATVVRMSTDNGPVSVRDR
ncbi:MAG: DUF4097 family beta strand repeat-containing protein [Thermoanaerobaculia bacterium]